MAKYLDASGVEKLWGKTKELIQNGDEENKELIIKLHTNITFAADKAIVYRGEDNTITLKHSATFDGKALPYTLQVNGTALASSYTVNQDTTFTGVFKINSTDPKFVKDITKTIQVKAYYPKYVGHITSSSITETNILDTAKFAKQAASSSAAGSVKVTSANNEYIWFCVPDGMTINKVTLGGFAVPLENPVDVTVTGKSKYKCYRTTNPLSADTRTFVIA